LTYSYYKHLIFLSIGVLNLILIQEAISANAVIEDSCTIIFI